MVFGGVIVGSLVLSLLAGAIANPDLYVAQHNVDRYRDTGKLSIGYMQQMSPDALSAIQQLPPDLRACALVRIADVEYRGDDWRTWNFPRVAARNALRDYVPPRVRRVPGAGSATVAIGFRRVDSHVRPVRVPGRSTISGPAVTWAPPIAGDLVDRRYGRRAGRLDRVVAAGRGR